MTEINRRNILYFLFLELVSISPLIIILGNIVPPFPLKVHFVGFGLLFLICLLILALDQYKKWIIYTFIGYLILQYSLNSGGVKDLVDFFFGPMVLVVLFDMLVNKKVPDRFLRKYEKRFYILLWVPLTIAALQFFNIAPYTFWNATYLNYVHGSNSIPRPNGLLFHGSELSVILFSVGLFQLFKKEKIAFWNFILLIIIALMTYFKAILGGITFLFFYFMLFINKGNLARYKLISKKRLFWYGGVISILGLFFTAKFLYKVYSYTGYIFPPQMLTGRGSIWNVYFEAINEFSFWNYLFGSGMGSGPYLFKTYATKETFYPLVVSDKLYVAYDAHNAILSLFVNSGVVGMLFVAFIFKIIYSQIMKWTPNKKWNKRAFFGVFVIPIFTIGITINMYDMAIIWPCMGFVLYRWYFSTHKESQL